LAKTREAVVGGITRLMATKSSIDEADLEKIEEILIGADVGVDASLEIVSAVKQLIRERRYATVEECNSLLKTALEKQFGENSTTDDEPFALRGSRPYVIMVVGVNGVGKTTTIGKLAHNYRQQGCTVMIASGDTFRAAANEQLEIWARRAGAEIVQQFQGSDPAAVAFDALNSARARDVDVVLIDTAGRLHTRVNLMEELKKVKRVVQKIDPEAPHEVLLVIDATTGQNGLQQAKEFGSAVGVTGLVLTKLDGTAKGGIVMGINRALDIPVRYVGVGEGIEDLQPFNKRAFVEALCAR
jgi:fused signal recognition particle receptor